MQQRLNGIIGPVRASTEGVERARENAVLVGTENTRDQF